MKLGDLHGRLAKGCSIKSNFKKEFPFENHFIEFGGHKIHYIDEGSGPVLLLLHGNPTFSFLYRKVIPNLKRKFRVIAPDYPGFGLSMAKEGYDYLPKSHSEVLEQFILNLDLKRITIFVQDWGGPIGLGFAGRNPALIEALVIGNTWAWPVNGDRHFEWFSRIMGGTIMRYFILRKNAFVNLLIPAGTPKTKISKANLKVYQEALPPSRRIATSIFPREILASKEYLEEVKKNLRYLEKKPSLILWGDKDIAFRAKERVKFESIFSNHKTVILKGAGHYIQEEAPHEIVDSIFEWSSINRSR